MAKVRAGKKGKKFRGGPLGQVAKKRKPTRASVEAAINKFNESKPKYTIMVEFEVEANKQELRIYNISMYSNGIDFMPGVNGRITKVTSERRLTAEQKKQIADYLDGQVDNMCGTATVALFSKELDQLDKLVQDIKAVTEAELDG
jgi:hypothetical protein